MNKVLQLNLPPPTRAAQGVSPSSFVTVRMLQSEERFFKNLTKNNPKKITAAVLLQRSHAFYSRYWQF